MQRVLVIGSPGAGKSVFAQRLAAVAGLPLVHLDRQYWRTGWVEPDKATWTQQVKDLIAEPAWVMDGNYGGTLPQRLERADTVVWLDMPRWRCLWRVVKRVLRDYGRTREDMTPGCPERFNWEFLVYVWRFPRDQRLRLMDVLKDFGGERVVLSNPSAVASFLDAFERRPHGT